MDSIEPYLKFSNFEAIILKNAETSKQQIIRIGKKFDQINWGKLQDTLFRKDPYLTNSWSDIKRVATEK